MDIPIPITMKAWTHTQAGLPKNVLHLTEIATPTISTPTEVLVRITHCSLNPGGSIFMQLVPGFFRGNPAIPEMDFSGVVVQSGNGTSTDRNLVKGTLVFGSIPVGQHFKKTSGALAEYVVVDQSAIVKKPDGASLAEVAGLGVAGATALKVVKAGKLKKGDSVLVNGASGGIGHMVAQMAKAQVGETGRVVGVCSASNVDWLKEYGCDETIDYTHHTPVHAHLASTYSESRFNVVLDAVGIQPIFEHCSRYLVDGGSYVTVGPKAKSYTVLGMLSTIRLMATNLLWPRVLGGVARNYVQVTATSDLEALTELGNQVEEKKLKVLVGGTHSMVDAIQAYDQLLSGHARGKIVVQVQELERGQ
ncbi:zinc-binding oxidoreductase [Amniculicola lignicola CBS 123094]|uniref:Zinc-binding oxidoreductase n=1 Tax=Amniculicola lignicola CBS 123094 TaxID=1392246 RepID=A0A6A5WLN3_9PLEO|nr:zinc-binding oxidoreductase [Amniculicola lignicola CBS 123094]